MQHTKKMMKTHFIPFILAEADVVPNIDDSSQVQWEEGAMQGPLCLLTTVPSQVWDASHAEARHVVVIREVGIVAIEEKCLITSYRHVVPISILVSCDYGTLVYF